MPLPKLWVNDIDMSAYGLWVNDPSGWADAPRSEDVVSSIPGMAGGILLSEETTLQPRELIVEAVLIASTAIDAHDQWKAIKRILSSPELEIRFQLWPGVKARCKYITMEWLNLPRITKGAGIRLTFRMPNPYLMGLQKDVYTGGNAAEIPLILGTAPSEVDLYLIGLDASLPTVYYKDAQGMIHGYIMYDFGNPLAENNFIHFSGSTGEAYLYSGTAIPVNVSRSMASASRPFVADPQDGDGTIGPFLSPLNCKLIAHVRKMYL